MNVLLDWFVKELDNIISQKILNAYLVSKSS